MLRLSLSMSGIAIAGRLGGMVVLWSATEQAINAVTGSRDEAGRVIALQAAR
jgi:hypothetical protein